LMVLAVVIVVGVLLLSMDARLYAHIYLSITSILIWLGRIGFR
jgi:hypothetical protein